MENSSIRPILAEAHLFRYASQQAAEFSRRGGRFVHYCSATAAKSIISKEEVWIRNSQLMNDFSEMEHGTTCLLKALDSRHGTKLKTLLAHHSASAKAVLDNVIGLLPQIKSETYIFSLSEHYPEDDDLGRLSMWRAYGDDHGSLAIILNNGPFVSGSAPLSPVGYFTSDEFIAEFAQVVEWLPNILSDLPNKDLEIKLFSALTHAVMCTKHPGFKEEQEWRLVFREVPGVLTAFEKDRISHHGFDQVIYKIPLVDRPDLGVKGIRVQDLVDRIIIGPVDDPNQLFEDFVELLASKGIHSPESKVVSSTIPFRRTIRPRVV